MAEPLNDDNLFSLKLYFIRDQRDPLMEHLLTQEHAINQDKYAHLQKRLETVFFDEQQINENYGHYLILTRAIEREKNHIAWLQNNLKRLV